MRLSFLGHAAFQLQTLGYDLVFDPFSPDIGYAPLDARADLVSISHENPKWHSHMESVGGDWTLYHALEHLGQAWDFDGIGLEAFPVFENWPDDGGEPDGPNALVKVTAENLRLLHMGDVGHALGDEYLEALSEIDIVLAPVGGPPTIALPDLLAFLEELQPRVVIPMHYGVPGLKMKLEPLATFRAGWSGPIVEDSKAEITLSMEALPREMTLHILEPERLAR